MGEGDEGIRPGSGPPDVRLAAHRGSRSRADLRGRRGPLARDPDGDAGGKPSRDTARGGHRPGRLRPIGLPGLVRRGPGVRRGAVAAGRGPPRDGSRPAGRHPGARRGVGAQRASFATAARDAPLAVVLHRPAIPPRPGGGEGVAGERGHRTLRDDPGPAVRPTPADPERRRPSLAHVRPGDVAGPTRLPRVRRHHDARPARHGPAGRLRSRWIRRRRKCPPLRSRSAAPALDRDGDRPARRRAGRFAARPRRAIWARRVRIARGAGRWLIARPVRRRGPVRPARVARRARIAGTRRVGDRTDSAHCSSPSGRSRPDSPSPGAARP